MCKIMRFVIRNSNTITTIPVIHIKTNPALLMLPSVILNSSVKKDMANKKKKKFKKVNKMVTMNGT